MQNGTCVNMQHQRSRSKDGTLDNTFIQYGWAMFYWYYCHLLNAGEKGSNNIFATLLKHVLNDKKATKICKRLNTCYLALLSYWSVTSFVQNHVLLDWRRNVAADGSDSFGSQTSCKCKSSLFSMSLNGTELVEQASIHTPQQLAISADVVVEENLHRSEYHSASSCS